MIGGAAIIWSIVAYQLLSGSEEEAIDQVGLTPLVHAQSLTKEDDFTLTPLKRDPFLGKTERIHIKKHTKPAYNRPAKKVKPKAPVEETPWPQLAFHGVVTNNNQNRTLGLLSVNHKKRIVAPGDQIDGLLVKGLSLNEITLEMGSHSKTISRSEE